MAPAWPRADAEGNEPHWPSRRLCVHGGGLTRLRRGPRTGRARLGRRAAEGGQRDGSVGGGAKSAACFRVNLSAGGCCSVDVQNQNVKGRGRLWKAVL